MSSYRDQNEQLIKQLTAAKESLMLSEERTRLLINAMRIGLIITDSDGKILSINPFTQKLFRKAPESMEGQSITSFIPFLKEALPFGASACEKQFTGSVELSDHSTIHIEASVISFGQAPHSTWMVSLNDVTERINLEELKQRFLEMITHDLKAPLSSIHLFTDLLSQGNYGVLNEEGNDRSVGAAQSCKKMIDLVNRLLTLEKLSNEFLELNYELTEVASLFEYSVELLNNLIEERGLELKVEGADIELTCDEDKLREVLNNFLSNAIKYSPHGGKIELVALEREEGIEISVTDEGPGIPDQFKSQIFERFFQVNNENQKKGTGLGLAICKEIIEAHNGELGVSDGNKSGSKFWFFIPVKDAE